MQPAPGQIIDIGRASAASGGGPLVETNRLVINQVKLSAGEQNRVYRAPGETIVHCLSGRIAVHSPDGGGEVSAHQLMFLAEGQDHALEGIQDSTILVIVARAGDDRAAKNMASTAEDLVDESSLESFPASDAPSWTPTTSA